MGNRMPATRTRGLTIWLVVALLGALTAATASTASATDEAGAVRTPAPVTREGAPQPRAISSATAQQLAAAMNIPAADIVSADLMGSDATGVGVSDAALGAWFPTQAGSFAILSTGLAADATRPDSEGSLSTTLGGLDNNDGTDLVRLHLQLTVPSTANCASFDFAFYSEEYPEYVGSQFNDTFTAQLNDPNITVDPQTNTVTAPGNFAFDTQGGVIEVNSPFGFTVGTGTTYDGSTPLLRVSTAVVANATIDIYLSVQDLGDSIWDTAVLLDNWGWTDDPTCLSGAAVGGDTDGDGLLDVWETDGLTVSSGGVEEFVDLPAMGANPNHKDIFVEIDWMLTHSHQPMPAAIATVVTAFDDAPVANPDGTTGIHLHVDHGPTAPLTYGAAATWGALSHSNSLAHDTNLGTTNASDDYVWTEFSALKATNLTPGRAAVAHYNIWAHNLANTMGSTSGISRGITASDFIVSLGGWTTPGGTQSQQAGTFMHELGHNLALRHGGGDNVNRKPNYRSVMNYAFQTSGLIEGGAAGNFDYSDVDLPDLNENSLSEPAGIGSAATEGTVYSCPNMTLVADNNANAVDWNCDGDQTDAAVSSTINSSFDNAGNWLNAGKDTLTGFDDWDNIVFRGGAIGAPGASDASLNLPTTSVVEDITQEEAEIAEQVIRAATAPAPTVGLVDVSQGMWHLRNSAGVVTSFFYGNPGDLPISGDWDGNGSATPGLYRQSDGFFYARNSNSQGAANDECFAGDPSDIPVVGDWDGDGDDNLGIYRPSEQRFYLFTIACTGTPMGAAQISMGFGNPGDKPVAGDWDGDGKDEVGLHRESTGFFYWRNTLDTGNASGEIFFGDPGDRFTSGDWGIVDGVDTPAIFRPSDATFYLRHTLTQGVADSQFPFGESPWLPVSGAFGLG